MEKVKRRNKSKTRRIIYAVCLVLWTVLLGLGVYFGLKTVWDFGGYWERAQISPKVDAYMERLSVEIWEQGDNGIVNTIAGMEHPFQTDEECVQVLKQILKDDLRCLPGAGDNREGRKTYNLLCGSSKFGQLTLKQYPFTPEENRFLNWAIEEYSLYPWEVESVQFLLDGLYTSFDITVPSDWTVVLNGHVLGEAYINERDIPYNTLADFYDEFEGLPTKVNYHAEQIFGRTDYQLLDGSGQPVEIDPEKDDSQFIEPPSEQVLARLGEFTPEFTSRYLEFCAGTGEMWYQYAQLKNFMLEGSDLQDRLYRMIESYQGWQHNYGFSFYGASLNGATALGNNLYVLDISADAGFFMPTGYKEEHRDFKLYVKYIPESNQVFAFAEEDYNV